MLAPVHDLEARLKDPGETLTDTIPSAITLAMMLRQRKLAAWLRLEFDGYTESTDLPGYRQSVPGHIVAKSPQYGWIPAPMDDDQKDRFGRANLPEGIKALEQTCLSCKKGSGKRILYSAQEMALLQQHINLKAELAITISRSQYSRLIRTVRATLYLWCLELIDLGYDGPRNAFTKEEKERAASLDTPESLWTQAMSQVDQLPIPDVREAGFFERVFGRTG